MLRLKLIFILVLLFIAIDAGATKSKNNVQKPVKTKDPIVATAGRHIFVAALFSTGNLVKYKGSMDLFGSNSSFAATEKTIGVFGFAAGYTLRHANAFGYSGELIYELPRPSSGINGESGGLAVIGTYDENPSKSLLTAAGNANYSIGEKIYFFAGVNYPFVFTGGDAQSFTGLPGYQVGAGFAITERLSVEASYRILRLKGTIDSPPLNLRIDEATLPGMVFAVHYFY